MMPESCWQTGDSGHAAVRHPETMKMRHSSIRQTGDRHRRGVEYWRYRAWRIERRSDACGKAAWDSPLCGHPVAWHFRSSRHATLWHAETTRIRLGAVLSSQPDLSVSMHLVFSGGMRERQCVAGGPLAGKSLGELLGSQGQALLGRHWPQRSFPLLLKYLDAREPLSLQVHPDDRAAIDQPRYPGFPFQNHASNGHLRTLRRKLRNRRRADEAGERQKRVSLGRRCFVH